MLFGSSKVSICVKKTYIFSTALKNPNNRLSYKLKRKIHKKKYYLHSRSNLHCSAFQKYRHVYQILKKKKLANVILVKYTTNISTISTYIDHSITHFYRR